MLISHYCRSSTRQDGWGNVLALLPDDTSAYECRDGGVDLSDEDHWRFETTVSVFLIPVALLFAPFDLTFILSASFVIYYLFIMGGNGKRRKEYRDEDTALEKKRLMTASSPNLKYSTTNPITTQNDR